MNLLNNVMMQVHTGKSFDRIMEVGFTLIDLFPDITDHISSI